MTSGCHQVYLNNKLQVADILRWILEQTGPADVRISSFSISDEFLHRLHFIREDGLLHSLKIVLDFKATHKTLKLWPFIRQDVEFCHLADNHSKVLLISNDSWTVTMVTSQNLTRGNRFEAGAIFTDPATFGTMSQLLDDMITYYSVRFNDVFETAIGED